MSDIHWIRTSLARNFPYSDPEKGIDFNMNGKIEDPERIRDFDCNGKVDAEDWRRFLDANKSSLVKLGGIFKNYFESGKAFKADNQLHEVLSIESGFPGIAADDVSKAYQMAASVLAQMKRRLADGKMRTPQQKLKLVYTVMKEKGLTLGSPSDVRFLTQGIKNGVLDCDTTSFIVLAVAHEMGWPVYLITVPRHAFVRWDDGRKTRFNMDFGESNVDEYYKNWLHPSPESIRRGIYLTNHTRNELIAIAYDNRAKAEESAGLLNESIQDRSTALSFDPRNFIAISGLASLYADQRRFDEAMRTIEKALSIVPDSAAMFSSRGNIKDKMGDRAGALKDYEAAVALDPKDPSSLHVAGLMKIIMNNLDGALSDFDQAIAIDPSDSSYYRSRAIVRSMKKDYAKVIEDCTKAIELDPRDSQAYCMRGSAKRSTEDYKGAIKDLNKALEFDPESIICIIELSRVAADQKNYDEAMRFLNKAIASNPGNASVYAWRGQLYLKLSDYASAFRDLNKAIELDPKSSFAHALRGLCYAGMNDFQAALRDADRTLELEPDNTMATDLKALIKYETDRRSREKEYIRERKENAEKIKKLNEILQRNPYTPNPFSLKAERRFATREGRNSDMRIEAGALWKGPFTNDGLYPGIQLNLGYSTQGDYHLLGPSAGLALLYKKGAMRLTAGADAGYDFKLSGDDSKAAVKGGGFFRYGAGIFYSPGALGFGATVGVQHEMRSPSGFAVAPGLSVTYSAW